MGRRRYGLDAVEMGGSVVVAAGRCDAGGGLRRHAGGLVCGDGELANCFAGFRVRQAAGVTVLVRW